VRDSHRSKQKKCCTGCRAIVFELKEEHRYKYLKSISTVISGSHTGEKCGTEYIVDGSIICDNSGDECSIDGSSRRLNNSEWKERYAFGIDSILEA